MPQEKVTMVEHIRVTGSVPAGLPIKERVEAYATAIDAGLRQVAASPDYRLQMILGEAYQKWLDLAEWVLAELEKDEAKAPGLVRRAREWADDPLILSRATANAKAPPAVAAIKNAMLWEAMAMLLGRPSGPLIEHDPQEPLR
jgi:hypothetical protein